MKAERRHKNKAEKLSEGCLTQEITMVKISKKNKSKNCEAFFATWLKKICDLMHETFSQMLIFTG